MNAHHSGRRPRAARPARGLRTPLRAHATLVAALALGLAGCSDPPWNSDDKAARKVPCGLVVDGSGSGRSDDTGVDVKKKLQETLIHFLESRNCSSLAYAPVTASSWTSSCRHSPVDLDPTPKSSTTDRELLRQRARNTAVNASVEMLDCARTQNGSDVLGGLGRIARTLRETQDDAADNASILAVSDFEQTDPEFRISRQPLSTRTERTRAVDKLLAGRELPALRGMDLYTVGYAKNPARKPSTYQGFDQFWTDILTKRAKAHVHHDYE
ncbi:hypothetical protein [Streptomyces xinghaiensis]|uniref:hypothetical protein n=1 Tax=Streptomyces xinghaiensis TaxID=1038928 RepID=UPI000685F7C2|nr:hypothetical protein [Streptomyces xinghaiensis]MZE77276.1 hypothetical protein [Streptomyces sp. SID5475]